MTKGDVYNTIENAVDQLIDQKVEEKAEQIANNKIVQILEETIKKVKNDKTKKTKKEQTHEPPLNEQQDTIIEQPETQPTIEQTTTSFTEVNINQSVDLHQRIDEKLQQHQNTIIIKKDENKYIITEDKTLLKIMISSGIALIVGIVAGALMFM